MGLLSKILGKDKSDNQADGYKNFWKWFQKHEQQFFKALKKKKDLEEDFFDQLTNELKQMNDGFFFLAGMMDKDTAELIITADGNIKTIPFVEELVAEAPQLPNWHFTALKPASDISTANIQMGELTFNPDNIHFYPNEHPEYPDEIDITIVYDHYEETLKDNILSGIYIFLDNFLGELRFATAVDNMTVTGREEGQPDLIPVSKLKDYLLWREKEFIEKSEVAFRNTEHDNYSVLEAELTSGNRLLAVVNTDVLSWENKASHPWVMVIEVHFKGNEQTGMPDNETYQELEEVEESIGEELKAEEGYINIGRQTAENTRTIFYACKEFRKPAKILKEAPQAFSKDLQINFAIYKDKYWRTFNRFVTAG
ncbi:Family of unknown function [Chitinophaga jiangningensis]|uniref:DUF695 domain-containing protein n=1 Tax=Chitinophaga jiangningensis TaxID=1419482 RepID=A0A1M7BYI1_9BACT|nr:DUF695 domain-containing protein [Chitinophaga jiangningensis]SHL60092.1 Family of unknown function [Chitinophaga jiangningensis]